MEKSSESTGQNLPREQPSTPDDLSAGAEGQVAIEAGRLESADLVEQAERHEKLRVVKRKTMMKDVWTRCVVGIIVLLFFLLSFAAVIFFIHYLTPFSWLSDIQVVFVTELSKYLGIGIAFFAFGRKFELIADIAERVAEGLE